METSLQHEAKATAHGVRTFVVLLKQCRRVLNRLKPANDTKFLSARVKLVPSPIAQALVLTRKAHIFQDESENLRRGFHRGKSYFFCAFAPPQSLLDLRISKIRDRAQSERDHVGEFGEADNHDRF